MTISSGFTWDGEKDGDCFVKNGSLYLQQNTSASLRQWLTESRRVRGARLKLTGRWVSVNSHLGIWALPMHQEQHMSDKRGARIEEASHSDEIILESWQRKSSWHVKRQRTGPYAHFHGRPFDVIQIVIGVYTWILKGTHRLIIRPNLSIYPLYRSVSKSLI